MKYFLTFFLLLAGVPTFAQITITGDQYAQSLLQGKLNDQNRTTYVDANTTGHQVFVDMTGENQIWNFSKLTFGKNPSSTSLFTVVVYPGDAPNANYFPTATHVGIDPNGFGDTSYEFYKIDQTGWYWLGEVQVNSGTKTTGTYNPPLLYMKFPLTYQTSWTSTSFSNAGVTDTTTIVGLVDGWGSFILPGNISAQALRLKTKTTNVWGSGSTDTSYTFRWFTQDFATPANIYIFTHANQKPISVEYTVANTAIVPSISINDEYSLRIGLNPVTSPTNLYYTLPKDAHVRISLMDAIGKESKIISESNANSGVNTVPIDAAKLLNGVYFLQIESLGKTETRKFIVMH